MKVLVSQSYPVGCSLPGSFAHGILQARGVGSLSLPALQEDSLPSESPGKAK